MTHKSAWTLGILPPWSISADPALTTNVRRSTSTMVILMTSWRVSPKSSWSRLLRPQTVNAWLSAQRAIAPRSSDQKSENNKDANARSPWILWLQLTRAGHLGQTQAWRLAWSHGHLTHKRLILTPSAPHGSMHACADRVVHIDNKSMNKDEMHAFCFLNCMHVHLWNSHDVGMQH
jgi:hypothetical protein